jgi:hypothetical protein
MEVDMLVSVEEYLTSVYEPDCDYLEGRLEVRNFGERSHPKTQARIAPYF